MERNPNTTLNESRTWSVDEMIDGLVDLISPLQTYGGICMKYIESHEADLKNDMPNPEEIKAEIAFYSVALSSIQNGISLIRDLTEWMQSLPKDGDGNVQLDD